MRTIVLFFSFVSSAFISATSVAAESGIRHVPLLASYAERSAITMSLSADGSYWFSDCRLPLAGDFGSAEQLTTYLNTQAPVCTALTPRKFQIGDGAQAQAIETAFNASVAQQLEVKKSFLPWIAGLNTFNVVLGTANFLFSLKRNSAFGVVLWTAFTYYFARDLVPTWQQYLEVRDARSPMIEDLVSASRGAARSTTNVASTLFEIYRSALIEATR